MKKITILLLHMQHGGIEKQTISFANEICKKYNVEIISTYSMKKKPAYEVNPKIKITYLIDDAPNKAEFKDAIKRKNVLKIIKESLKAIKILYLKNKLMKQKIKKLDTDFVLSTRIEFANMLSKYTPKGIVKITQEHLHNDSNKYIKRVKKSFKNLDYLIVLGPGSKENYSKWLKDNKKIEIIQIPNILEEIPKDSSLLENYKIISVGRLHPVKDFESLIYVFDKVSKVLPQASLTIVGGGEEFEKLITLSKKLNLENKVKITGMISKDEVNNYLLNSDLYVMTSLTECFPMVLLEASSCGLPLISFDVPVGPKAIIKNDYNGYLIQNRNIDDMAKQIIELFNNRTKLKLLGKNAKESANQYIPNNVMKKWFEIFDK